MKRQTFAKRSLGQNFLVDQNYVRKIVGALDLKAADTVVEIGPGRGAITESLVGSGANVIAIELDRDLVPELRSRFESKGSFFVVEADATAVDFSDLITTRSTVKLVANLPYYISTPILQHLSTQRYLFERFVLMFQKEVVDRITAKAGDSGRGFLTVLVEAAFDVERLFDVPPNAFRPVPKVTSSVARFIPKVLEAANENALRDLLSIAFAQKRKTIANNLKTAYSNSGGALERACIDGRRRAETLTLSEWRRLMEQLEQLGG